MFILLQREKYENGALLFCSRDDTERAREKVSLVLFPPGPARAGARPSKRPGPERESQRSSGVFTPGRLSWRASDASLIWEASSWVPFWFGSSSLCICDSHSSGGPFKPTSASNSLFFAHARKASISPLS